MYHQCRSSFALTKGNHIQPQDFVLHLRIELVILPLLCASDLDENSGELAFCPLLAGYSWENQARFHRLHDHTTHDHFFLNFVSVIHCCMTSIPKFNGL